MTLFLVVFFITVVAYKIGRYHGERRNYVFECKLEDAAYRQGYRRGHHHSIHIQSKIRNNLNQYVN